MVHHVAASSAIPKPSQKRGFFYALLPLLFSTRPASIGSRGGPFLAASILYERHKSEQSALVPIFLIRKNPYMRTCFALLPNDSLYLSRLRPRFVPEAHTFYRLERGRGVHANAAGKKRKLSLPCWSLIFRFFAELISMSGPFKFGGGSVFPEAILYR